MRNSYNTRSVFIIFSALGLTFILSACGSTRSTSKYDYLRTKGLTKEPYKVIDIAVLDTANARPGKEVVPPPKIVHSSRAIRKVVKTALSYIGTPYQFGGMGKPGIDCSGLVVTSFREVGLKLPRTSAELARSGRAIKRSKIQAGDLVFFSSNNTTRINHVGLVTQVKDKSILFVHSTTSKGVREDRLDAGYWSTRYRKARRM